MLRCSNFYIFTCVRATRNDDHTDFLIQQCRSNLLILWLAVFLLLFSLITNSLLIYLRLAHIIQATTSTSTVLKSTIQAASPAVRGIP